MSNDPRNIIDKYKGLPHEDIVADLDTHRFPLEIAIENLERDFNMGTIVRTANAFNVNKVHIIGRRQWNKRGAMKTDAYLHIEYYETTESFLQMTRERQKHVIAVDIVSAAAPLSREVLPLQSVLVFGSEGSGLSDSLLAAADQVVYIEQFGSTRSINVGVAAGIVMYEWVHHNILTTSD